VKRRLTVVSLFTGAGGLDYGFEAAGFETRVAIESDLDCVETLRRSRSWPVIAEDIRRVSTSTITQVSGLTVGDVDALIGGPPCQPFSKSAYWANGDTLRLKDARAHTLRELMRCVKDLLPKVFVIENVPGIGFVEKSEALELIKRRTRRINRLAGTRYALSCALVDAADYGVPQHRKRLFVVGHRHGSVLRFPAPTHGPRASGKPQPYMTAWDAIGRLRCSPSDDLRLSGRWADLLPSIPEGHNYLWHTNRGGGVQLFGWRTRYWSFLLKLAKNQPSPTLQAHPGPATGPFHWSNRRLSVEEMARLQTFPSTVVFAGSHRSVERQIGNAVPSLLAEVLAREIRKQLLDAPVDDRLELAVRPYRPIPAPKPVVDVPRKYLVHLGSHPDHPGEGRGPRSRELQERGAYRRRIRAA
jgi:DNA (cytosine-5)-methyltransferase 1